MSEQRAPKGGEWGAVLDVLHALGNMITVRSHYTEGHPAIQQADENASAGFTRVLDFLPDLVVALVDGEFIVCERPLPDLGARLHALADAMTRHEIECLVFQRGMTRVEAGVLGSALALPAESKGRIREQTQAQLMHVLLRFVVRAGDATAGQGATHSFFVPAVHDCVIGVARALANETPIDKLGILAVANQIVVACMSRSAMINQRSWTRSFEDEATHAANVAIMTAALCIDAGYPQRICIDATAAAMMHDIGHLFLPEEMRGVPEPMLDERSRPVFRNHTFAGAAMLLGAGCSPLWVAAAFEHHRGVDAGGYPALDAKDAPHELVRFIAIANYFDSKRTRLRGHADDPEDALASALALEDRYFGTGLVRRFLRVFGVFPPGTTVELSTLEPAIVTRANPSDPWRPQVKVLRGPNVGKLFELRDMHPAEVRHRLSIVRAMAPPLLVMDDAFSHVPVVLAPPPILEEVVFMEAAPVVSAEVAARDAHDRARASLGGMDAMLDALLTVPTEALVSAMPPAPSTAPRPMTFPSMAPIPVQPSRPPIANATSVTPPPREPTPPPRPIITTAPPRAPTTTAPPPRAPIVVTRPPPLTASRLPPTPQAQPAPSAQPARVPPTSTAPGPLPSSQPMDPQELERQLLEKLGSLTAVPVLVSDPTKLNLDHRIAFVLRFIDGMSTVDDILDASGLPRVDVLRVLDYLVTNRVAKLQ